MLLIDWHAEPAAVTSCPQGTTFENARGDRISILRGGVEATLQEGTFFQSWSELRSLLITFPEVPWFLSWPAALLRDSLAGGPRAGSTLEFCVGLSEAPWFINLQFGSPRRQWNLASRQFFAGLERVLPVETELPNPDLVSAYTQFSGFSRWRRAVSSKVLLRRILLHEPRSVDESSSALEVTDESPE